MQTSNQSSLIRITPSFFQIMFSDYLALLGITIPLIIWSMILANRVLGLFPEFNGPGGATFLFYFGWTTVLIGLPIAFYQTIRLRRLLQQGERVSGEISTIHYYRYRCRVAYRFVLAGELQQGAQHIFKGLKARRLRAPSAITVVVDPNKPDRSTVVDLF